MVALIVCVYRNFIVQHLQHQQHQQDHHHAYAQKIDAAHQNLRALPTALHLAQEVGKRLGEREVLFRPLPP